MPKAFRFDNTLKIKQMAEAGLLEVPEIPVGKESFKFNIGDTATTTEFAVYKPGIQIKITDRYIQHGYAYYVDTKGKAHRNKDLK